MTELYIDGQLAALPEGFNITFTSENPYFTRSSNYSLDIELPMPANHAIFKHVNRLDVTKKKTILPATLIVDARCLLYGSAVLLSVEDALVKVQLVSGNAEFNLLTNDDLYIDELDLGTISWPNNNQNRFQPPANMVNYYGRWTTLKLYGCRCSIRKPNGRIFRTMQSMSSARTILPFAPIMAVDVYNHTF